VAEWPNRLVHIVTIRALNCAGKSDLENDDKVPRWGGNQKGHLLRQVFYKPADYVEYLY
jgi:hypothetical protein